MPGTSHDIVMYRALPYDWFLRLIPVYVSIQSSTRILGAVCVDVVLDVSRRGVVRVSVCAPSGSHPV
jgi:subtilisin-like proprotein convertase family protein